MSLAYSFSSSFETLTSALPGDTNGSQNYAFPYKTTTELRREAPVRRSLLPPLSKNTYELQPTDSTKKWAKTGCGCKCKALLRNKRRATLLSQTSSLGLPLPPSPHCPPAMCIHHQGSLHEKLCPLYRPFYFKTQGSVTPPLWHTEKY